MDNWLRPNVHMKKSREILAENVRSLMDAMPEVGKQELVVARARALGRKIAQSTVSRVRNAAVAIDLDTLDVLASVFKVEACKLLKDNLGVADVRTIRICGEVMPPAVPDGHVAKFLPPAPRKREKRPHKKLAKETK